MTKVKVNASNAFAKIYASFIEELKTVYDIDLPIFDENLTISRFQESVDSTQRQKLTSDPPIMADVASIEISPGVQVGSFSSKVSDIPSFFSYLLIMSVLVISEDESIISLLASAQKGNLIDKSQTKSDEVFQLLTRISQISTKGSSNSKGSQGSQEKTGSFPFPEGMEFLGGTSKICKIAEEISKEIDMSGIKCASDVLNPENNILGDIVSKVGSKIHKKISSGELNQEDLLSEAFQLLSSFGGNIPGGGGSSSGSGGGGFADILNNPMFKNVMQAMGKSGMGTPSVNTGAVRNMTARTRLRSKLEKQNKK